MTLTLKEVLSQIDYLVIESSCLSVYPQDYDGDTRTLEYDNGDLYLELAEDTLVEATSHNTLIILGTEYRAYVAQQVYFKPSED